MKLSYTAIIKYRNQAAIIIHAELILNGQPRPYLISIYALGKFNTTIDMKKNVAHVLTI